MERPKFSAESIDDLAETAKELLEYQRENEKICELECMGITVRAKAYDQWRDIVARWKQDYNFFGLSYEDRLKIYQGYVVEGLHLSATAKKTGVSNDKVSKYVHAKGWARTLRELREQRANPKDVDGFLNSWDSRNRASRLKHQNSVQDPYVCKVDGTIGY